MATPYFTLVPENELSQILDRFEAWLYTNIRISNSTAALYLGFIRRAYPTLGPDPSHEQILSYIVAMRRNGAANNSVCATCTALERFSAFLGRPIRLTRPPKNKKMAPQAMSEAEVAVFLHAAKNIREKAILATVAYTGIRNNEFCNLRVRDVDIANGLVHVEVGKFGKERVAGIAGAGIAILVEYMRTREMQPDNYLFVTVRNGLPLEPQDIRKLVHVVAKRAGFTRRIWPHLFRHSLATNMLNRGAHIFAIKDQLGHAFIESTMIYLPRSQGNLNAYRQYAPSYA